MATPVGGIDADDRAQGQASGSSESGTRSGSAAVTVVALRGAISGLVVITSVAAVVERHWLEGRTPWVVGLSVAVLAGLWRADRSWAVRGGLLLATGAAAAATVVAATSLGRRSATFSERVLAEDLPPPAAYALTFAVGVSCLGCLALVATAWRWGAPSASGRLAGLTGGSDWRALGIAVLAVALITPATLLAGGLSRGVADRRAEQRLFEHTFQHRAERLDETPGPAQLTERLWDVDLPGPPPDEELRVAPTTAEAIPGWDVVVVHQQDVWWSGTTTSRLIAYSKTDGDELWRYERGGAFLPTVDPASGRILLVSGAAAVVLSLEDGGEVTTRRLPDDLSCDVFKGPVVDEYFGIVVGSTAVVGCSHVHLGDRVALFDVATAQLAARLHEGCNEQHRSTATATPAVVLETRCPLQPGPARVLALDPDARRLERIAEVAPPPGSTAVCELPCNHDVDVGEDLIVATLTWTHQSGSVDDECDDAEPACRKFAELVALTREGQIRWRTQMGTDLAIDVAVMAVSDHGVLVRTDESWQLLSLVDGSELARQPRRADEEGVALTATDGQRIYTVGVESDTAVVRRLDDLSVVETSTRTPAVRRDVARASSTSLSATSGRLVYVTAEERRLVAYGDG